MSLMYHSDRLASREAGLIVSAFRSDGVISTTFGAFDASTIDPRAAADVLRYLTLRGPTATDADARKGCRMSIIHSGSPCSPRWHLRPSHHATLRSITSFGPTS